MRRRTRSEIAWKGKEGKEGKEMAAQYGLTIDSVCYAMLFCSWSLAKVCSSSYEVGLDESC